MPRHTATRSVQVASGHERLDGDLQVPAAARGLVIFAHGSGSSRFSGRNRQVATALNDAGFATLLLDLLTPREEAVDRYTGEFRFDIPRLGERVVSACDWVSGQPDLRDLPIGCFGASTGAAAALMAAAERPRVSAVVSRGGRPDLAARALPRVEAPTLLIVGGDDEPVIGMNKDAMRQMTGEVRLEIVPGATHLFEEPGTLEQVSRLAIQWFEAHLTSEGAREIASTRWDDELEAFSRAHRGWLAHVERDDRGRAPAKDRPLLDVRPDRSGSRVLAIQIRFSAESGEVSSVRIDEPVKVAVETGAGGGASGLRIEDAAGGQTTVRFRVEPPMAMLDGVAPGEL